MWGQFGGPSLAWGRQASQTKVKVLPELRSSKSTAYKFVQQVAPRAQDRLRYLYIERMKDRPKTPDPRPTTEDRRPTTNRATGQPGNACGKTHLNFNTQSETKDERRAAVVDDKIQ